MENQRNVQSYDTAPRAGRGLPGETAREPRRSTESGIVKLERRRTPLSPAWWIGDTDLETTIVWRGGW
jgi:hypothetical protein